MKDDKEEKAAGGDGATNGEVKADEDHVMIEG